MNSIRLYMFFSVWDLSHNLKVILETRHMAAHLNAPMQTPLRAVIWIGLRITQMFWVTSYLLRGSN